MSLNILFFFWKPSLKHISLLVHYQHMEVTKEVKAQKIITSAPLFASLTVLLLELLPSIVGRAKIAIFCWSYSHKSISVAQLAARHIFNIKTYRLF